MDDLDLKIEEKVNAIKQVENNENVPTIPSENVTLENLNSKYLNKQVEEGKTVSEIASDFAKARITSELINNEDGEYNKLHKELAEEQKETLKESFKQDKFEQQSKTLTEKQKKAEAFYTSFRPILEFDFSPLIHKKEKDKDEKPPKTYKDRSYGIPLMVLMLILFVVPYCVFSIVLALFNGLNAITEAIATFSKIAKGIAISIFIIAVAILVVYCALLGIDYAFGTNILSSIGL